MGNGRSKQWRGLTLVSKTTYGGDDVKSIKRKTPFGLVDNKVTLPPALFDLPWMWSIKIWVKAKNPSDGLEEKQEYELDVKTAATIAELESSITNYIIELLVDSTDWNEYGYTATIVN